ncbi:26S proteasome regulatory subunit 6A (26S proteasome AAA-ATPase subunit RPT5) (Proteasome 26S subunit ATPase 3) (Proteasome subunit P50) (Tat-binding protein 1) (TBP-1) [Durusdinium trenchii]|uniref:26S proteasome regulatory subunit 6A (26S proteasome AAA-ATPase subunit RPT5) (Proteasome 26S subunit ATPase 3) (Proteasome subunit P50) (Tat-binding protein 1) (TBP-1) n=1 Tax=Durusdinium trenchii TaxID=1381693 RepID=A0ABP0HGP5_9DINO
MTHKERFENIGIQPPKGVLMHGPPGTGKTMMARACAAATSATFLKLAAPQLVQMFIGDGAKIVRDAFVLAKEKAPAIIFIDELDAIGQKRSGGGELSGVREVQRTMLELLNQLDGFTSQTTVKIIAATNRPDTLDPALLRSGRLDRKIELPHPNEDGPPWGRARAVGPWGRGGPWGRCEGQRVGLTDQGDQLLRASELVELVGGGVEERRPVGCNCAWKNWSFYRRCYHDAPVGQGSRYAHCLKGVLNCCDKTLNSEYQCCRSRRSPTL